MKLFNQRKSGILCPIFSLPSPYGIGSLGKSAYQFVNFLQKCDQTYWQILPLGQTGYGDSPYACFSSFAGNPYFIDLDLLIKQHYLKQSEIDAYLWNLNPKRIDYGYLYMHRYHLLEIAAKRFLEKEHVEFNQFVNDNAYWLDDYALFMTIKKSFNDIAWNQWPLDYQDINNYAVKEFKKKNQFTIKIIQVIQYFFFMQYQQLLEYANKKGIYIVGDIPIYVAYDSCDVWAHKELFDLNANYQPNRIAGCPPDGFSANGQIWGNPLYRWDVHKQSDYSWWMQRIGFALRLYNGLRLDHFRGFAAYYSIDALTQDAKTGYWVKGCGKDFFDILNKHYPDANILVEDLGYLDKDVMDLLKYCGYPGIKLVQFAFDTREPSHQLYFPYQYPKNCVAYTGTHDNPCINGWIHQMDKKDLKFLKYYLNITKNEQVNEAMLKTLMASQANTAIICLQDLLYLDNQARINTPNTLKNNWQWRFEWKDISPSVKKRLKMLTQVYDRGND